MRFYRHLRPFAKTRTAPRCTALPAAESGPRPPLIRRARKINYTGTGDSYTDVEIEDDRPPSLRSISKRARR